MIARQEQALEMYARVRSFMDANPVSGRLNYDSAGAMLDDALRRLREYARDQLVGYELARAELARQRGLVRRLFNQHMRPIVTIARAQIDPSDDIGLPAAFQLPRTKLSTRRLLAVADGMMEVARPYARLFIENGLPVDFLAWFKETRDELQRTVAARVARVRQHIDARLGLETEMRRARRALDRVDAIVRAEFHGDEGVLAAWRSARRVHQRPGGRGANVAEAPEGAVSQPPVPETARDSDRSDAVVRLRLAA